MYSNIQAIYRAVSSIGIIQYIEGQIKVFFKKCKNQYKLIQSKEEKKQKEIKGRAKSARKKKSLKKQKRNF